MRVRSLLALAASCVLTLTFSGAAIAATAGGAHERVIVVLRDDVGARAAAQHAAREHGAQVSHVYEHALRGFSAVVPAARLNGLRNDPRVDYVERDRMQSIQAQTVPTGVRRIFTDTASLDIDGTDDRRVDVDVAVLDTGIDFEHPDLNVSGGVNCLYTTGSGPPWARDAHCEAGGDDDHYHGTHVAGTVGAIDNGIGVVGVAPGARLWAVKVLDSSGSGYESNIVAGIDWVAAHAATIEVANMSLGGSGYSQAEYDAIQGAVDEGVAFAVAAGNSDADASKYSPAAFDNVLTVSALADFDGEPGGKGRPTCRTDQDDTLADFSNWGPAVQIAAPGVCIASTYPIEQGGYGTISGTSMASPHAAGALALLASSSNPGSATDVHDLYGEVIIAGNFDWTDDSGDDTKEPLLDVEGFSATLVAGDGSGDPTDSPPVASFTSTCSELSCTFDASTSTDDGGISSYAWTFGDDSTGSGVTTSHAYADGGTYTVTLTVTDGGGQSNSAAQDVTVTASSTGTIALTAAGHKVKGLQKADLRWTDTSASSVDVYRNGVLTATTPDDGTYTDDIDARGGGSYRYRVCEAGTTTCSNEATVTF